MKTIGLIGGMTWESTVSYYRTINRLVGERLGGLHSARILLYSVDFHGIAELQRAGRWNEAGAILAEASAALERAGADFLVLCTNTMHRAASAIEARVRIPLLHIADATGDAVRRAGIRRVGLLGTRFTMEDGFYKGRLESRFDLKVAIPGAASRQAVHRIIYEELCRGTILDASRKELTAIVSELAAGGAQGVILGCTELGLLLRPEDSAVPLFDTTAIHAAAAASLALTPEDREAGDNG